MQKILDLLKGIMQLIDDLIDAIKSENPDTEPEPTPEPLPPLPDPDTIWHGLVTKLAMTQAIPEQLKPAILAQAIIESGRGRSLVARKCLNFWGMKWRTEMRELADPMEVAVSSEATGKATFCKFRNIDMAIAGYWKFVHRDPYGDVDRHTESGDAFLTHIGPTWCPPGYTQEWIRKHQGLDYDSYIMQQLQPEALNLLARVGWDLPRTDTTVGGQKLTWIPWAEDYYPRMPTQGRYPDGYPKGAIVHFTAGSTLRSSMEHGRKLGYTYLGIDYNGKVYQGNSLARWGYHSGTPHHRTLIGIEIACAGGVEPSDTGFVTWFGKQLSAEDVRLIPHRQANQFPGYYHKYTHAQENALIELLIWLKRNNPDVFDFDKVIGHDEARIEDGAPGRKNDPGGALSMDMPTFREGLKAEYRRRFDA